MPISGWSRCKAESQAPRVHGRFCTLDLRRAQGGSKRRGGPLFFFFLSILWLAGSSFPDQGSNPCPLQWKLGVLTVGPPGDSQRWATLSREDVLFVCLLD